MVCRPGVQAILDRAAEGQRLGPAEALTLFEHCHDLPALGKAANAVCNRLHPEGYRTYNIDRNVNYTNICSAICHFCAFYRKPNDPDAYVLDLDTICTKVEETVQLGGDQILLQGGMHPVAVLALTIPDCEPPCLQSPRNLAFPQVEPDSPTRSPPALEGGWFGKSARGRGRNIGGSGTQGTDHLQMHDG